MTKKMSESFEHERRSTNAKALLADLAQLLIGLALIGMVIWPFFVMPFAEVVGGIREIMQDDELPGGRIGGWSMFGFMLSGCEHKYGYVDGV